MSINTRLLPTDCDVTAQVALDPAVSSGQFVFYGDKLSFNQVADIAEKQTGFADFLAARMG